MEWFLILLFFGAIFGVWSSPMVKKYGTRYNCGEVVEGLNKGVHLCCFGKENENNNIYWYQDNTKEENYDIFPFQNIKKYQIINRENYNSVQGALVGNFVAGGLGAMIGASGNDKIYIAVTWVNDKTSLLVLTKNGYDKFIKNTYNK